MAENNNSIDYFNNQEGTENQQNNEFREQELELPKLYKKLTAKKFNINNWIQEFIPFVTKHKRIRYALLTAIILNEKKDSNINYLMVNLDKINSLITVDDTGNQNAIKVSEDVYSMYFKFFDHCSLALSQREIYVNNDEKINKKTADIVNQKFEKQIDDKVAEYDKNITNQLIGLVSIFTALSFVIFGGIGILRDLLEYAKDCTVEKLLVAAVVWLICMSNIFLLFIKLIAVLTNKRNLKLWIIFLVINFILIPLLIFLFHKFGITFKTISS